MFLRTPLQRLTSPAEAGDPRSKICLIGQAPARTEMRAGKPFVGPAGSILDECLHAAGIVRASCYITNVFETELSIGSTGNLSLDGEVLWTTNKGFTEAAGPHLNRLYDRLANSGANIFVCLGGTALQALTGKSQIMKWRGSILEASLGIKGKVIGTIHPAAVLRGQAILKYPIISDLRRARAQAEFPELRNAVPDILIEPSFTDAKDFLRAARSAPAIASDIEIGGHGISCFSVATDGNTCMSIPLLGSNGLSWTIEQETELLLLYAELMGDQAVEKWNQNISFDLGFNFANYNIHFAGPINDTMVGYGICYPDFPKGLGFINSIYTEIPYYKDDGKVWQNVKDWPKFYRYNGLDAIVVMRAWPEIWKEVVAGGYEETYRRTMRCLRPLIWMQTIGMAVDQAAILRTKEQLHTELAAKEAELAAISEQPFNPRSSKQCINYFYVVKGHKAYTNRATGNVTSDDKAMARMAAKGIKEAKLVQDIRGLDKLLGTYVEVELDQDQRLHAQYNIRGTTTGRLSSGKTVFGTGLGMQNLDPKFKQFLRAD